jgi:5-methylthioribose kinase
VYPGTFFLTTGIEVLPLYLASRNWLMANEVVERVSRAGEGNMNCVLRVLTSRRTFILKQSRPWVEKYPSVPAPWDRALVEARFYRDVGSERTVAGYLPKLLGFDPEERLLMLEDLGEAQDFTFVYWDVGRQPELAELNRLIDFLIALHTAFRAPDLAADFSNREMRSLNHEHIFALPLRKDNDLDLESITPGLSGLALHLQHDPKYCSEVGSLGDRYMDTSRGICLIHGDYFPGSWLRARQSVYVIDPEFCFYGPPEWDLGVMTAHLYFAGQPQSLIDGLLSRYAGLASVNLGLVFQFAGVEIMRRLIGVAQLPVKFGPQRKAELLQMSQALVLKARAA